MISSLDNPAMGARSKRLRPLPVMGFTAPEVQGLNNELPHDLQLSSDTHVLSVATNSRSPPVNSAQGKEVQSWEYSSGSISVAQAARIVHYTLSDQ